MQQNKPFFSIAIPTYGYNGSGLEFLDFSFNILSKQTFTDFEVIVSDHSIDDSIKNYLENQTHIQNYKYYRNEYGRGIISPNINNAMKYCNGKWIKILFQDDFLYNEHSLNILYEYIISNNNAKWIFNNFYHSNSGIDFYRPFIPEYHSQIWNGNNTVGCPSSLSIINDDIILFNEDLNWLMDVEYYKRLELKYGSPSYLYDFISVNRTWGNRLTDTITEDLKNKEYNMLYDMYGK
jgi:hypothetical protein